MALVSCDLYSESLEVGTSLTLLLPQSTQTQIGVTDAVRSGPPPVLYLLHGLSDDHTAWLRYTAIERYAAARGLAVVMPAAGRSFYRNEAHGHRYWDWVSEELPRLVAELFRVSSDPADTFVAGLSMGGYGALKHAFTHPERYAAAASLSGVTRVQALVDDLPRPELVDRVFGGDFAPGDDLFQLLEEVDAARLPALYLGCGTEEDPLVRHNTELAEALRAKGVSPHVDLRPGVHEWGLWDAQIRDVIEWLPIAG
jgi:putative tributyrin esterase